MPPNGLRCGAPGTPLTLSWPATTGVRYNVLATTNLGTAFQMVGSVVASNALVQWPLPAAGGAASFYRVSLGQ